MLVELTRWLDMASMFAGPTVKFVNKETHQIWFSFLLELKGDGTIVKQNLMSKRLIHPKT